VAKSAKDHGIKLTPKQERFCLEYLIDLNATQAAIRAGYSEKTANEIGTQNLAKLSIQQYLKILMESVKNGLEITRERIEKELARIAFAKITDIADFDCGGVTLKNSDRISEDAIASIESISSSINKEGVVTINLKRSSKISALQELATRFGYGLTIQDHMKAVRAEGYEIVDPTDD
jgi:phage terminase small subunit